MDKTEVNLNRERFNSIFKTYIKREGSDKLLDWLNKSDFFTAPASTKFHSAMEGGLCYHSLNVFDRFNKILKSEYGDDYSKVVNMETIAIVSLLHDVCKTDCYRVDYRNVKVDGEWVKQPYYVYDDKLPYGHGEKSVYMINGFMHLTRDEAMAINWHMGGFDARVQGGSYAMSDAYYAYPIALLFHVADLEATYLDEEK